MFFFDVVWIIVEYRLKVFLFENVKNFVNYDKGNMFKVILWILCGFGYYVLIFWVINVKGYVL